ncbi:hypothetical protein N7510_007276 [Penicillium lagena]|uniref:uncharacterized protein n=1 Tax=Penicillium lagena TaxID=94218 RepID=UPI0025425650|nr:uncharacterized protein N7510_007276 [Penicillium lagena]KAJ5610557.1 hypothetical protein N7510_007276 [Penicillium lagena]
MAPTTKLSLPHARPYSFNFPIATTAFVIIDMQRDFLDPDGFGFIQCGNPEIFASVRKIVPTIQKVLDVARSIGMQVIHTREGHRPDLSDLPAAKRLRQISAPHGHHTMGIGDQGPMGKLLVRNEWGQDIIDDLKPQPGEPIIDKPGKGSFWNTGFHRTLLARGITHLIFAGVTTDQDGLFGYVGHSSDLIAQAERLCELNPPCTTLVSDAALPSIAELQRQYKLGLADPVMTVQSVFDRIEKYDTVDPAVWISKESRKDVLAAAKALSAKFAGKPLPPLFGIPFAVKDSIDVTGIVTTVACESFAYTANSTAPSIQHLLDAGALYIGKVNLDQLATGLSGCRSPYGIPHSVYSKKHISGGSSSGSGVAVAAGLVSFAIGTDTAGSTRVPAALNGIVGFKPTKGTISARGLVPACKSLDTITIMAPSIADAREFVNLDDRFPGTKGGGFTFGVPPRALLETCSKAYQDLFQASIQQLRSCGGRLVDIDYTPFTKAGDLLYDASLVHERLASMGHEFFVKNIDTLHPTTKTIFQSALSSELKAWQVFQDQTAQIQYTVQAQKIFNTLESGIDVLVVPSVPCHPTIKDMLENPVALNSKLGTFTHAGNVVDLCGVSVNAGWVDNEEEGKLPFGVTFLGGSGYDGKMLDIAAVFEDAVTVIGRN